mmetsp:Transcript_25987/g.56644  ORF Transcript_25987/g.56644 Transcript_25987/m.56644 type:complete len:80 (-) Transcript_25987:632-871(-)
MELNLCRSSTHARRSTWGCIQSAGIPHRRREHTALVHVLSGCGPALVKLSALQPPHVQGGQSSDILESDCWKLPGRWCC